MSVIMESTYASVYHRSNMTNLAALKISDPGDFSALNGLELVNQKVKRWVSMGGGFPSTSGEFNFNCDAAASFNAEDRTS